MAVEYNEQEERWVHTSEQSDETAIEIWPSSKVPAVTPAGKPVQVERAAWVKISVNFSRGENSLLRRLTGSQLKVYLAIALRIDDSYSCFPGIDTIAEDSGLHRTSVMRAITALEEIGLITTYRCDGKSNTYMVTYVAYGRENEPNQSLFATGSNYGQNTSSVGATPTSSVGATLRRTIEEEPPSSPPAADDDFIEEVEYVPLDDDGFPTEPNPPIIDYLRDLGRHIKSQNQINRLTSGVPKHNPRHPSPNQLYQTDPLFPLFLREKVQWANGEMGDGRKANGRLVSAIANYDTEKFGWFDWKEDHTVKRGKTTHTPPPPGGEVEEPDLSEEELAEMAARVSAMAQGPLERRV